MLVGKVREQGDGRGRGGGGGVRVSGHKELLPPLHFMLYTFTTFCYDYSLLQDTGN